MENNLQAVIDAGRAQLPPTKLHHTPGRELYFVPRGANGDGQFYTHDTEAGAATPLRKRGAVTVFDAASFNMVLADNKDAGNIAIYIDRNPTKPAVVAVLNGNGPAGPGWGDFRASIEFRPTPQWAKWTGIDGKMLPQATFAEFIEDNLADIADPAGARMLEIATHLEATRTVNFKSAMRLSNGNVQFHNNEDTDAKVSAGKIDVPEIFVLALAPLQGLPLYKVPARFRYRITEGKLALGLKLQRVEDLMTSVLDDVVAKIDRGDNISVIEGRAPDATR
jgi:uncharacterized protein YfdQ (DUF2303 family)